MGVLPNQQPDNRAGTGAVSGTNQSKAYSGTSMHDDDDTSLQGQYPPGPWGPSIFGGPLPSGTGAPGTQGAAYSAGNDPTTEPGQTSDGLTGVTDQQIGQTGAPGMATTPNGSGGATPISYTRPGSYLSGTYQADAITDDLSGVHDSTQANDTGYGTGGPQLPGLAGNEPVAGGRFQPGSGKVLRGGRDVKP